MAKRARSASTGGGSRGEDDEPLHHARIVTNLPKSGAQDVKSLMKHARERMFCALPDRAAGMNSTTISKVLNFQRDMVPIVSVAHLHALSRSPTSTDREIAEMQQRGELRKISVPGRGRRGGAPVGDGVILVSDWTDIVRGSGLDEELQDRYLTALKDQPTTAATKASDFSVAEVSQLVAAGLFTSTSAVSSSAAQALSRADAFSLGVKTPVSAAGTTAPTGSHDAVGGVGAVHLRGGGSGGLPSGEKEKRAVGNLTFSIPGTGAYLKLLTEAEHHLVQLLVKSSPRYQESLRDMLRERWDGNVLSGDAVSRAKRARGEWNGVLAGQTKKWKSFYGIDFDWILEECLGAGLVECFDTGSVGLGVRVVR